MPIFRNYRENWIRCDQCPKKFTSNTRFAHHIILHHSKEKSFRCVFCCASFRLKSKLWNHTRKKHTEEDFTKNINDENFNEESRNNLNVETGNVSDGTSDNTDDAGHLNEEVSADISIDYDSHYSDGVAANNSENIFAESKVDEQEKEDDLMELGSDEELEEDGEIQELDEEEELQEFEELEQVAEEEDEDEEPQGLDEDDQMDEDEEEELQGLKEDDQMDEDEDEDEEGELDEDDEDCSDFETTSLDSGDSDVETNKLEEIESHEYEEFEYNESEDEAQYLEEKAVDYDAESDFSKEPLAPPSNDRKRSIFHDINLLAVSDNSYKKTYVKVDCSSERPSSTLRFRRSKRFKIFYVDHNKKFQEIRC